MQIVNGLFGMTAINVLYGTEVIFNCLSHSQARPDVSLYTFLGETKIFHWIWKLSLKLRLKGP